MADDLKRLIENPNLSSEEKRELALKIAKSEEIAMQEEKDYDMYYKNSVLQLLQSIDEKLGLLLEEKR